MGKSYNKGLAGHSQSNDWHSPHSRNIQRNKKNHTHKVTRRHNKNNVDETNYEKADCKCKTGKMFSKNGHCHDYGYSTIHKNHNLNFMYYNDTDDVLYNNIDGCSKWKKEDGDIFDQFDEKNLDSDNVTNQQILISSKKQLSRRGKMEVFKGHRNSLNTKN
jgi:hypothetical protein